jgi:Rhodopirellula transposase DDE domain
LLFCRIAQNRRGRPHTDHVTIIELNAETSAKNGLKAESALDTRVDEKGIKVTKTEMKHLDMRDALHPEWNYSIVPRKPKS